MDGISVHEARRQMGLELAESLRDSCKSNRTSSHAVDVVVPVPETSFVAANALAQRLDIPLEFGLAKSRYSTRTFIMSKQEQRRKAVWRKLTAVAEVVRGRNVLLVDDSIVRGTTSQEIVRLVRKAGAKSVCFASASPAIRHGHIYGIDLAQPCSLIANGRSDAQVADAIDCDRVVYLEPDALKRALRRARVAPHAPMDFEIGVFTGVYATPGAQEYLCAAANKALVAEIRRVDSALAVTG